MTGNVDPFLFLLTTFLKSVWPCSGRQQHYVQNADSSFLSLLTVLPQRDPVEKNASLSRKKLSELLTIAAVRSNVIRQHRDLIDEGEDASWNLFQSGTKYQTVGEII